MGEMLTLGGLPPCDSMGSLLGEAVISLVKGYSISPAKPYLAVGSVSVGDWDEGASPLL